LKYFLLYKPFGYLSQFTKENEEHKTLADLGPFPPDVYPVGRLDLDSEGLLLLTNDAQLNQKLLHPANRHWRTYWVQVEGIPTLDALQALQKGVDIKINKKTHRTLPAKAHLLSEASPLPERDPPIRYRANIPDTWLELSLCEGKNRQVRRMCAKVGYPVLRLVRVRMEHLSIENMQPGEYKELDSF
jgi:23S rRNA pseudouridine2457 synthase